VCVLGGCWIGCSFGVGVLIVFATTCLVSTSNNCLLIYFHLQFYK